MAHLPENDDLASICSSLSSDDGVRGSNGGGGRTNEHLIDLLTRPRSRRGYGGRLSYGEFSSLAHSLGWSSEDMDDCWYDIMMGEASAEAVDMVRVAECVCSYCLASPLPLLENYKLKSGKASKSSSPPPDSRSPSSSRLGVAPPSDKKGESSASFRPSTAPGHTASSSNQTHKPTDDPHNTTVLLSPPSPILSASHQSGKKAVQLQKKPANRHAAPSSRSTSVSPRYAVETVSSECRKSTAPSPHPLSRGQVSPSSPCRRRSTAAPPCNSNTVFFRLYENGMEQQRQRHAAKLAAAAQTAEVEAAACTFRPIIQPYKPKAAKGGDGGAVQYNKPTQSYFAKLMDAEKSNDAIAHAPATPRVTYHPAPGPSSSVPTGYVEGVARLRRYVAARYEHAEFKNSLRDPVCGDVDRLVEAPILRLPVTVEGVADTVDVRLASAHHRYPSKLSREQTQQQRRQLRMRTHAEENETRTPASTPRRSSSGMMRYKEHPVYY